MNYSLENLSISIIIPCYNEEHRISNTLSSLETFILSSTINQIEIIFIDDGSLDNTKVIIQEHNLYQKKIIKLISYKNNHGKGYALKKGVDKASGNWIITMDNDLSVDFSYIPYAFKKLISFNHDIYFGSRNHINSQIIAKGHRKILGNIFQNIIKFFLKINLTDTQCGFKIYKLKVAKEIFSGLSQKGFIHDVEIVLISLNKNILIKEIPVIWEHKAGSKVNILIDSLIMFKDILKLKLRYKI